MKIPFTKMQGLGNDFVIIDATQQNYDLKPSLIQKMADRHYGIGFDQLLMLEKPTLSGVDFNYRIFNADGSEVGQCGNGARCIGRFIHDAKLSSKKNLIIGTKSSQLEIHIEGNHHGVTVNMGVPTFDPIRIPFIAENQALSYALMVDNEKIEIGAVAIGNPHAVIQLTDIEKAPIEILGPKIEKHDRFPERANVGFMQIQNPQRVRLRVYERGVGETLACGSGACAAMAVGRRRGLLEEEVTVTLPGGNLVIHWGGENQPIFMTGPAERVFTGEWLQ